MKKRLLSLILISALVICCTSFGDVVLADTVPKGNEALLHLRSLEILPTDLTGDGLMTRGMFAQALYRIAGNRSEGGTVYSYTDVSAADEFYDAIQFCTQNGYMTGSNGAFRPQEPITYAEGMTVLIRALRYTEYEGSGAGALDCYIVAKKIGLLKNSGFTDYGQSPMYTEDAAVMLFNALRICPNHLSLIKPEYYTYKGSNQIFAYETLGLNYADGVMTANGYVDISGHEGQKKDSVIIGDNEFSCRMANTEYLFFLGQEVSVFYDDNANIVSIAPTGKSNVLDIAKHDFSKKNGSAIEYYQKDKLRKASLSSKALFMRNGETVLDYKATGFDDAEFADIHLIDADANGVYDYVFVNVYETFVIASVSSDSKVYSRENAESIDLSGNNPKDILVYNAAGVRKTTEDLKKDCVLSVIEGNDFIYAVYANSLTRGKLNGIGDKSVTVDSLTIDIPDGTGDMLKDIPLGSLATLYFDFAGRLVYARKGASDTDIITYGYLVRTAWSDFMSKELKLKIFTNLGEMKVYPVADKFEVDGSRVQLNSLNGLPPQFCNADGSLKNSLVMYELNSDGEIKSIIFPKTALDKDEDGFIRTYSKEEAQITSLGILSNTKVRADGGYFSGKEFLNNTTEIFIIPDNLEEEENFSVVSKADVPVSTNFIWDTYHFSKYNGFADAAVIYKEYTALSYDTGFSIVLSQGRKLDADGIEVTAIEHFRNNSVEISTAKDNLKIKDYIFENGTKKAVSIPVTDLKPGDGVRLTTDKDGRIRQGERIYEYHAAENGFKGSSKAGAYATHALYLNAGYVAYNDTSLLRLCSSRAEAIAPASSLFDCVGAILSSAKFVIVEEMRGGEVNVYAGTSADVAVGDYVITQSRSGRCAYVIVYKDK